MTEEPERPASYREPLQARSAATLARVLRAAEEIVSTSGLEEMTIAGVAQRAGVSVGTIYRRFEDKEQLVTALTERMLDRREEYVAEQLRTAEPSLCGVMDAYAHALLQSFAGSSSLFPELLRTRGTRSLDRGARTISELHRLLLRCSSPLHRPDPPLPPWNGTGHRGPRHPRSLLPQLGTPRSRHRRNSQAPVRRRAQRHGNRLPVHSRPAPRQRRLSRTHCRPSRARPAPSPGSTLLPTRRRLPVITIRGPCVRRAARPPRVADARVSGGLGRGCGGGREG
ncbi:TetR/AcrR family transcriptional regulator [Streptomyces sp. NPDC058622]|uniref:TetR/AcrR family transcriptional regulator n=1 Tax=Streptomyces sp. NPDC058622 TaxID=3346562 RepID=UPI003656E78E